MAKFKYNSRKFLNKKSGLAAIESSLESWEYGDGFDCNLTISDCNRTVSLDFSAYDVSDLPLKYQKLTLLLGEVNKLHSYYTENYEDMVEVLKKQEEKRKERIKQRKSKAVSVVDELQ